MKKKLTSNLNMTIGRESEKNRLNILLKLNKNILIEGPVGVGKTYLVISNLKEKNLKYYRIDGDNRFTEQKLTGWFDPPLVLKKGYSSETFIEGPLVEAMKKGCPLFINELNRMPEGVQNILLPAMDERRIYLPKLGELKAEEGFLIIATQNPKEFTATFSLSEALLDRFEMITLFYPNEEEEFQILKSHAPVSFTSEKIASVLQLIRLTRQDPSLKRGASLRAGISLLSLLAEGLSLKEASQIALPSRVELLSYDTSFESLLDRWLEGQLSQKKN